MILPVMRRDQGRLSRVRRRALSIGLVASVLTMPACSEPSAAGPSSSRKDLSGAAATVPPATITTKEPAADLPSQPATRELAFKELFPHVRADIAARVVEFDARVSPMLVPDPNAPMFFLEVVCCTADTREHESLLVADAKPSHIHAALLAIGLTPGKPGGWTLEGKSLVPFAPTGDSLLVRFCYTGGAAGEIVVEPNAWIKSAVTGLAPTQAGGEITWVFAGSRLVDRPGGAGGGGGSYDADGSGQVIGLHTFGSELAAWPTNMNPDASVESPEWLAALERIPKAGTPVRVRIRPAAKP